MNRLFFALLMVLITGWLSWETWVGRPGDVQEQRQHVEARR